MKSLPSPRQLQYLIALSEIGHFGRAAARCLVTQSTLSAGLKELEAILGVTLVERSQRRVVMTPLGRTIAARGREVLQYLEDLVALAASRDGRIAGPLSMGVIPTIAPYLMPAAMGAVGKSFPALKLFLREEQTDALLARLREGSLDIVLMALPYETDGLEVFELGSEDVVACIPAGHELASHKAITPAMIARTPFLTLEAGHCLRDHAWAACRLSGRTPNEVFQATSLPTLVQMVAAGLGVTLLPRMAVPVEALRGVVVRPLSPSSIARTIALVWRDTSARGEDFKRLGAVLKEVCGKVIAKARSKA
jgi:LysR family transcriptional regulator, hydrogen peroxide-inducible genes activator